MREKYSLPVDYKLPVQRGPDSFPHDFFGPCTFDIQPSRLEEARRLLQASRSMSTETSGWGQYERGLDRMIGIAQFMKADRAQATSDRAQAAADRAAAEEDRKKIRELLERDAEERAQAAADRARAVEREAAILAVLSKLCKLLGNNVDSILKLNGFRVRLSPQASLNRRPSVLVMQGAVDVYAHICACARASLSSSSCMYVYLYLSN